MGNKIIKDNVKSLLLACVVMVLGILFCCSLSMGVTAISVLIGIIIIACGALYIIGSLVNKKSLMTMDGVVGAVIIAFGVLFIANELVWLIVAYIPWLLMAIGIVAIVDAFLSYFLRKEKGVGKMLFLLLLGAISLALGICLRFIDGFIDYASLVLGLVMVCYAIYVIFSVALKLSKK